MRLRRTDCLMAVAAAVLVAFPSFAGAQGLDGVGAFQSDGFADGVFVDAICDLFGLIGGQLGAMLTGAALCTGLIAAAVGGFQNVKAAVAVGVASFAFTAGVSLYFGSFNCGA